jgi:hypothetical protein
VLDGAHVMAYVAFLLRERGLRLNSIVQARPHRTCRRGAAASPPRSAPHAGRAPLQAGHALYKAIAFAATELVEGSELPGLDAYVARSKLLTAQLQAWATKMPSVKPSFAQLVEAGKFVPLPEILRHTLPHITAAVENYSQTPAAALRVRDGALLSACTATAAPSRPASAPRKRGWAALCSDAACWVACRPRGRGRHPVRAPC